MRPKSWKIKGSKGGILDGLIRGSKSLFPFVPEREGTIFVKEGEESEGKAGKAGKMKNEK